MLLGLVMSILFGCDSKKTTNNDASPERFVLSGEFEDVKEGVVIIATDFGQNVLDSLKLVDGKFTFTGDFPIPTEVDIKVKDEIYFSRVWAENDSIKLRAAIGNGNYSSMKSEFSGGEFQTGSQNYYSSQRKFYNEAKKKYPLVIEMQRRVLTEDEKKEGERQKRKYVEEGDQFEYNYIKNNSKDPFCAHIIYMKLTSKLGGEKAIDLKPLADLLDQSIRKHKYVQMMFDMLNSMLETETGVQNFVKDANNVKYKVDKSFKGSVYNEIVYMGKFKNNNICALSGNSTHGDYNGTNKGGKVSSIQIIDPTGKEIRRFDLELDGSPNVVAVDDEDLIYVITVKQETKVEKVRGIKFTRKVNKGVECVIYNALGKKVKSFPLEGLKNATGAKCYEGALLISDVSTSQIKIYKCENGDPTSTIEDLRPCCSILDFDVDNKGQIVVANLGSFRVDAYNFEGNKLVSFGERGRGINQFSGCCNPVSLSKLDNGCVVTVEKTPTRIKVYSKDGAHIIEGIEELVKGCFHIPVVSDSKNNIYLASPEKGLVKCVTI
jgi:hypothetical protein